MAYAHRNPLMPYSPDPPMPYPPIPPIPCPSNHPRPPCPAQAPHGEKIALTFVDFDVTGSDGCSGDYVSLTSDLTSEGQRFCGSQGPGDVTSDGDILVLRFASNAQGSCRGFNASYHVKEGQSAFSSSFSCLFSVCFSFFLSFCSFLYCRIT